MTRLVAGILLLSLALAGGLSLLASQQPDGLEHSLASHQAGEGESLLPAPMPDYEMPVEAVGGRWRRVMAGLAGTLAVFGLVLVVGAVLRRTRGRGHAPQDG